MTKKSFELKFWHVLAAWLILTILLTFALMPVERAIAPHVKKILEHFEK